MSGPWRWEGKPGSSDLLDRQGRVLVHFMPFENLWIAGESEEETAEIAEMLRKAGDFCG